MQHSPKDFKIRDLVAAWKSGDLSRNEEYQRGATWTVQQKQGLIDSIFRRYPIPPLFLHRIVRRAPLTGDEKTSFEVVDGQQRIRALVDFMDDKFTLLRPEDKKLRLPTSMRSRPVAWGGLGYKNLPNELRIQFEETEVRAHILEVRENDDEIRDLFVRLQAGTALGRQQIRDAWPGNIGPFINSLAGKMDRRPRCGLFRVVDLRGQRGDDEGERDEFVADRQTCAQLLRVFIARESDPVSHPSVAAEDLDALYHEHPDFVEDGVTATRFVACLGHAEQVLSQAIDLIRTKSEKRRQKFRKLEVFALVNLFQDLTRNPNFKVTQVGCANLANAIAMAERANEPLGRITSGRTIGGYYEWWRANVVVDPGVRLDPRRCFDAAQRDAIRMRDGDACGICREPVADSEAEVDHFPIPYRDGGATEIENGRLVHRNCHERGRPPASWK